MTDIRPRARLLGPAHVPLLVTLLTLAVALPAAAEVLYVASPNRVLVLDSDTGTELAAIDLGRTVFDIAFSADGSRAYLALEDGVVEVDAQKHAVLGRLLEGPSFAVELSSDAKSLHVLGNEVRKLADGQQEAGPSHLSTIELATRTVTARHELGRGIEEMVVVGARAAVTRPEGRELALVGLADGQVAMRTAFTEMVASDAVPGMIVGLAAAPDAERLYLGQFGDEAAIHVLDLATGGRSLLPFAHEGFMTAIEVSPDGSALLVATRNHLAVLETATGTERAFVPLGGAHMKMALSPDGRRSYHSLPTHDEKGGAVTVVDLERGQVARTIATPGLSPLTIGVRP